MMKKLGLILGIIGSIHLVGCNFLGNWDDFELKIDESAFDFGQPSFGPLPGETGSPIKIDSATHLENHGLKLWTSADLSVLDSATTGEMHVEYWENNYSYESQTPTTFHADYLPDSISNEVGQKILVFPLEISLLKLGTNYEFCINLHLFKNEEKINEIGTCKPFRTAS